MFPLYDTNPHRRTPWLTLLIILINVLAFAWTVQLPDMMQRRVQATHGFVPHRIAQLTNPKLEVDVNLTPDRQKASILRLKAQPGAICLSMLTMMFLHGGWLHLIGNVWFLWIFGNNIEDRLGHVVFVLFYLLGGLLALACHWAIQPESDIPVIGASGAVAAVLGAYAITYPKAKVRTLIFIIIVLIVDLPALLVLGLWFLFQLVGGLAAADAANTAVAWWADVGGFAGGLILMPLMSIGAPPPLEDWHEETDRLFDL